MKWLLLCLFAALALVGCKSKQRAVKIDVEQRDSVHAVSTTTTVAIDTTRTATTVINAETIIIEAIERVTTYDTAHADNRIVNVAEQITRTIYNNERKNETTTAVGVTIASDTCTEVDSVSVYTDKSTDVETKTPAVVTVTNSMKPILILGVCLAFLVWLAWLILKKRDE